MLLVSSGLAQYSGDPKTEWHLDAHGTRDSLLEAVSNLPYKGGNTLTGTLICFMFESVATSAPLGTVVNVIMCVYQDEKWTLMSSLQVWLWTTSSRTISERMSECDPTPERSVCWSLMANRRTMSSPTLRTCVIRALSSMPSVREHLFCLLGRIHCMK